MDDTSILIQARMGSSRFPGKVLAPVRGTPLIQMLIKQLTDRFSLESICVLTTGAPADRPLVSFLQQHEIPFFLGPEENVFERYRQHLEKHPIPWFFRVCGDSPLLDPDIMEHFLEVKESLSDPTDLITNIYSESFPSGHRVELIRTDSFLSIDRVQLSDHEREHITQYFYNNSNRYTVKEIEAVGSEYGELDLSVDTVEDLKNLETFLAENEMPSYKFQTP